MPFNPADYLIAPAFRAQYIGALLQNDYQESDGASLAIEDGVATISVTGALLHREKFQCSSYTGYEFISNAIDEAITRSDVLSIVLDMHSGGGIVWGCFELCDQISFAKQQKPIYAVVNAVAYSACYAIASVCSEIICTESGGVGSVGLLSEHFDYSKMFQDLGIDHEYIFAGSHKVDGNPYEPLPIDVKEKRQKDMNATYNRFTSLVAQGRGMTQQAVIDTQALCYSAKEALSVGFIDKIMSPSDAYSYISGKISTSQNYDLGGRMSKIDTQQVAQEAAQINVDQIAAEAKKAERERISAIMCSDDAKGREELANHFAFNTSMSVDDCKAAMAVAPKKAEKKLEQAAAPEKETNHFAEAMDKTGNPNVGHLELVENTDEEGPSSYISSWEAVNNKPWPKRKSRATR